MGSIFKDFFDKGKNSGKAAEIEYYGQAPEDTDTIKISAKIFGRVQGVGFRFTTKQAADELGLNGIVRNESDGSVYCEAIGSKEKIEQFVHILAKGPSPSAQVERVTVEYDETIEERNQFTQTN